MPESQIKVTLRCPPMGTDLDVVNAARVSFDKESEWDFSSCPDYINMPPELVLEYKKLPKRDVKLIHYLAKHEHYSPFGHCFASFRVEAPVFVRAQLVKHKFLRLNEVSRRYVDSPPEFYTPDVWRGRAEDKKQGSEGVIPINSGHFEVADNPYYTSDSNGIELYDACLGVYNGLLKKGVAPEQARMVLPQSMMTQWVWSGSMDAFAAMCKLRLKLDAQYESRLVAQQIDKMLKEIWPVSWEALLNEDA